MTRCVITTVIGLVLLYPSQGLTEIGVCGPQDYDSEDPPDFDCPSPTEEAMVPRLRPPESVPVRRGEEVAAEWDGALVHRDRLLEVGLRVRALRRLRWADRLRLAATYRIELTYAEEVCTARVEHMEAQRDAYREQWLAAERRAQAHQVWWRSPILWVAVGAVITVGLVLVAAYGLTAVGNSG